MRIAPLAMLLIVTACESPPPPVPCSLPADCAATERCTERLADGGHLFPGQCLATLGGACSEDSECARAQHCDRPTRSCAASSEVVVPCDASRQAVNGDACEPLPAGFICFYGYCDMLSGIHCNCELGHWRCFTEARDYRLPDGGASPCGDAPQCWASCGAPPP